MRPIRDSLAVLVLLSAPLAAQRRQAAYIAPTNATIFTETEESSGDRPGQVIWVYNRSSVGIVVNSVALRNCENVKESCSPQRLNLKVRPSSKAILIRVHAKDESQGFRYSMSFGWRADSGAIAALKVLADAGNAEAKAIVEANTRAEEAESRRVGGADIYLDSTELAGLGPKWAGIVAEPDSVEIKEGLAFLLGEISLVAVDSAGGRLGRVAAGMRWRMPGTPVLQNRADTIFGALQGRAEILFQLRHARPLEAKLVVIVRPDSGAPAAAPFAVKPR